MFFDKFHYTSRPAMAKTVTETNVAMRPIVPVDILFAWINFIDAARAFQPFSMKIFPKSRCAFIQHCAVIILCNLQLLRLQELYEHLCYYHCGHKFPLQNLTAV